MKIPLWHRLDKIRNCDDLFALLRTCGPQSISKMIRQLHRCISTEVGAVMKAKI